MDCNQALDAISAALDNELSDAQRQELEAHLAQCPKCRTLMAELSGLSAACGPAFEAVPPADLKDKILANLPAQAPKAKGKIIYWKRWAAMAACFAVVALAAWRLPEFLRQPPKQDPPAAASGSISADTAATADPQERNKKAVTQSGDTQVMDEAAPAETPQPTPAPEPMPSYVTGPAVSANLNRSAEAAPATGAAKEAAEDTAGETSDGTDSGDAISKIALFSAPAPGGEPESAQSPAPMAMYSARRANLTASAPETDPSASLKTAATDSLSAVLEDARPENAPVVDNDTQANDLEEITLAAETAQTYCGVLTLQAGQLAQHYEKVVQDNGDVWYTLPAAHFRLLLEELKEGSVSYALRDTGADISPAAQNGLVIIQAPQP